MHAQLRFTEVLKNIPQVPYRKLSVAPSLFLSILLHEFLKGKTVSNKQQLGT